MPWLVQTMGIREKMRVNNLALAEKFTATRIVKQPAAILEKLRYRQIINHVEIAGFTGFKDTMNWPPKPTGSATSRARQIQACGTIRPYCFAHQRSVDLSTWAKRQTSPLHKQPVSAVIFNGEIYNYKEPQAKLSSEKAGKLSNSLSDTEVVLEMYKQYGPERPEWFPWHVCLSQVYDRRASRPVRARIAGIKPLFSCHTGRSGTWHSARNRYTLLHRSVSIRRLTPIHRQSAVFELYLDFRKRNHVWRLLSTFSLHDLRKTGRNKMVKYWDIKDQAIKKSAPAPPVQWPDVANTMSFQWNVMVADVPVSCFSAAADWVISVPGKRAMNNYLPMSIGTEEKDKSVEKTQTIEVCRPVCQNVQFRSPCNQDKPDVIRDLAAYGSSSRCRTDLATRQPSIPTWSAKWQRNQVKVLLSGMGADEIFFGYRRQKATLMAIRFNRLPKPIKFIIAKTVDLFAVKISQ